DSIITYLESINPITAALYATLFTWLVIALGSSFVFFFKGYNKNIMDTMLGFTGGVMVAASVWGLLIPAIDMSEGTGFMQVMPSVIGFLLGAAFLYSIDKVLPHVHVTFQKVAGGNTPCQITTLMILAIALHHNPEGLAV